MSQKYDSYNYAELKNYGYPDIHELLDVCMNTKDPKLLELLYTFINNIQLSPKHLCHFKEKRIEYYKIFKKIQDENGTFERLPFILEAYNKNIDTLVSNNDFGTMMVFGEIQRDSNGRYRLTGGPEAC